MSFESFQQRAVGGVPELEGLVQASGDDEASVGGEGDRIDPIIMTFEGFQQRPGRGVPELKGLVFASGDDEASVGGEDDRPYRVGTTQLWHNHRTLRQDITPLGARGR